MNSLFRAKIIFNDGTYEWFWDSTDDWGIFEYDPDIEQAEELDFLEVCKNEILEQYQSDKVEAIKFYPLIYNDPITLTV